MVSARRSQLSSQLCAAALAQLIRVDADAKPELFRSGEHSSRVLDAKHVRLAKNVAVARKPFPGNAWKHFIYHQPDVIFTCSSVLLRNLVGAQKSRYELEGTLFVQSIDDPQNLYLII